MPRNTEVRMDVVVMSVVFVVLGGMAAVPFFHQ